MWSDTLPLEWSPEHPACSLLRALRDDGGFQAALHVAEHALPIVDTEVSTTSATAMSRYYMCQLRHTDLMRRGAGRIVANQSELY